MRDVIVMGSGRSGSSLAAGSLSGAGYFMGGDLLSPNRGNPGGYFESPAINALNYKLVRALEPVARLPKYASRAFRERAFHESWIASVPLRAELSPVAKRLARGLDEAIREFAAHRPWCFKDPRFSHTYPFWEPHLGDALRVVTFRHPDHTADSTVEFFRTVYDMRITRARALAAWQSAYEHILHHRERGGDWLFLHYDQLLGGSGFDRLEAALGCVCDRSKCDSSLRRERPKESGDPQLESVYERLCALAEHAAGTPR